jgi:hypothetical protein
MRTLLALLALTVIFVIVFAYEAPAIRALTHVLQQAARP